MCSSGSSKPMAAKRSFDDSRIVFFHISLISFQEKIAKVASHELGITTCNTPSQGPWGAPRTACRLRSSIAWPHIMAGRKTTASTVGTVVGWWRVVMVGYIMRVDFSRSIKCWDGHTGVSKYPGGVYLQLRSTFVFWDDLDVRFGKQQIIQLDHFGASLFEPWP